MKIVLYLYVVHHNLHQSLGPMTNYRNFYKYLRARGYPDAFLAKNFRKAPSFTRRHNTLFGTSPVKNDDGVTALILPYSPGAIKLTTGVLVDREGYLPPHLAKRRNVYAWRRAPKIQDLTKVPGRLARDAIHIAMP